VRCSYEETEKKEFNAEFTESAEAQKS
jgi:hypothetical protein